MQHRTTRKKLERIKYSGEQFTSCNIFKTEVRKFLILEGRYPHVYNAAAQMGEAKLSGVTVGTYTYNAYNQRTKKVAGGNTTHYVYGPGGALLGEYNGSGALIREYIHLNGEPLAQIEKSGGTESILYLHTDHLLTARYATNAAGSTVWSWDSGAFGKNKLETIKINGWGTRIRT